MKRLAGGTNVCLLKKTYCPVTRIQPILSFQKGEVKNCDDQSGSLKKDQAAWDCDDLKPKVQMA